MVSQFLRAALMLAAIVPLTQSPLTLPYTGTVTDASGKPIAGVRVVSGAAEDTRTDAGGRYTLTKPLDLIRFSLPGYRPVTKLLSTLNGPVILELAAERPRVLPACSDAVKHDKRQADMPLRLSLPRLAKIKTAVDQDDRVLAVGYRVDWMMNAAGSRWSDGLPELKLWKQAIKTEERDITVDDPGVLIADYSGMLQDGSHYRVIGLRGQRISYTDATVDSAAYFDSLLDTLCWNRP
jgi:hypothetical protein